MSNLLNPRSFFSTRCGRFAAGLIMICGMLLAISPVRATHPCTSPLILDLDHHGIETTGVENAVDFDINGDGWVDRIGWTSAHGEEAFLWLDGNRNGRVDDGSELFGTSTRLPSGEFAENGFEALAVYDSYDLGGNEDGRITSADLVWRSLRLWIDENHDAESQGHEVRPLRSAGVLTIDLDYEEVGVMDGHGNVHGQRGTFSMQVRRFGRPFVREQTIEDVYFIFDPAH